jgi:hypothetical protein
MLKNLSSRDVAWVLKQLGITFKRHGKEDVFGGLYNGRPRVVIVPRNNKEHPTGDIEFYMEAGGNNQANRRKVVGRSVGSAIQTI